MIAESEIRSQLGRFLRAEISLDRLEDWLAQKSWNMHKDSDAASQKLASAVELRLAEHSSGHLDECALRDELRQLVNPKVVQISFGRQPFSVVSAEEPSDNVVAKPNYQSISFTVRAARASSPAPVEFAGTEQSVAHG